MHAEDITSTSIIATVTLESDGSFSIGIEDGTAAEGSDARYITGLSEGHEYDSMRAVSLAGQMIAEHLAIKPMEWRNSTGTIVG